MGFELKLVACRIPFRTSKLTCVLEIKLSRGEEEPESKASKTFGWCCLPTCIEVSCNQKHFNSTGRFASASGDRPSECWHSKRQPLHAAEDAVDLCGICGSSVGELCGKELREGALDFASTLISAFTASPPPSLICGKGCESAMNGCGMDLKFEDELATASAEKSFITKKVRFSSVE
jgi:hypothetical protein